MALVIRWVLDSWQNKAGNLPAILGPLLESLCLINCAWLAEHPEAPGMYDGGPRLRYQRERSYIDKFGRQQQQEDWRDYPAILRHGGGDCEDVACGRTAEYRVRYHLPARPIVTAQFIPWWSDEFGKPLHPDPHTSFLLAQKLDPKKVIPPHWLYHIKVGIGVYREDPSLILGMGRSEMPNPYPEIP